MKTFGIQNRPEDVISLQTLNQRDMFPAVASILSKDTPLTGAIASWDPLWGTKPTEGARVLITGRTDPTENGIYIYSEASTPNFTLTLSTADADTKVQGKVVFVQDADILAVYDGQVYKAIAGAGSSYTPGAFVVTFTGNDTLPLSGNTADWPTSTLGTIPANNALGLIYNIGDNTEGIYQLVITGSTYALTKLDPQPEGTLQKGSIVYVASGGVVDANRLFVKNGDVFPWELVRDNGAKTYRGFFTIVDGTTAYTITHNLNSQSVGVEIIDRASKEIVLADTALTTVDTLTITVRSGITAGTIFDVFCVSN